MQYSFQMAQMQGGNMPSMNVNEQDHPPPARLRLHHRAVFLVPMITMRLFAEEKKTGTIELLLTSPGPRSGIS
jgi:ABC-2 type transport system permease protein